MNNCRTEATLELVINIDRRKCHEAIANITGETALKLSKSLNLPLEQIMHMPTPVLLRKLAEAEAKEKDNTK